MKTSFLWVHPQSRRDHRKLLDRYPRLLLAFKIHLLAIARSIALRSIAPVTSPFEDKHRMSARALRCDFVSDSRKASGLQVKNFIVARPWRDAGEPKGSVGRRRMECYFSKKMKLLFLLENA